MGFNNCLFFVVFFVGANLYGQPPPNYIYEGGTGSGFDGMGLTSGALYIYEGANSGGYASMNSPEANSNFYGGGHGKGYTSSEGENGEAHFYNGGAEGGYAEGQKTNDGSTFYVGGSGQGYNLDERCEDFTWTGTMGTGWGEAGNWNYNMVPTIKRNVIIPDGAPNYPNVNAGVFAIGDNPNNGAFVCKSVWVQSGGLLITRINNFVENYGKILIDGNMRVKNSAVNAIQNESDGKIRITPTGALIIKP